MRASLAVMARAGLPIIFPNKPKIVPVKRSKIIGSPEVSSLKFVEKVLRINWQAGYVFRKLVRTSLDT